jgi:hypothetical protein
MYWIFLIIFVVLVLVPDIIRGSFLVFSETRVEEISIFILGAMALLVFIKYERAILIHKEQKEKDQKKIDQTVKDLVESYSYIGEVNRKMDLLMNIALGLTDRSVLSRSKENEIYEAIASAANFLLKADSATLRFVQIDNFQTKKEIRSTPKAKAVKNADLEKIDENINALRVDDCLVISSSQDINKIRCFLMICGYDKLEEQSPKNTEILKVFVSQALFVYSYMYEINNN